MLDEFKTFIAVVEHKSFTKAGESLHLSQPSVSSHIKHLENSFGVVLINRSIKQKSITITENGEILYIKAKELLHLLELTYAEVQKNTDSVKGSLKIGASLTIGEYLLPQFLATFAKSYPDIDVEIFIENTSLICSYLKNLTLDIGLIEGNTASCSFNQEYFLADQMVLAIPYDPTVTSDTFSFSTLQDQKWIVREEGSGTREYLDMFLSINEITPKSITVLGSNYAIKEAVKYNLGITILSHLVATPAAKAQELSIIELDPLFNRHFSYLLPKNIVPSRATKVFLDALKAYSLTLDY